MQTYQIPGTSLLFALNLDPDNKTFWTADYFGGGVFRVDIATGTIVKQFNANKFTELSGLAVVGEITAASTAPPSTTSYYVTTSNSTTLHDAGRDVALSQIAAGINQDNVVALLFRAPTLKNGVFGVAGLGTATPLSTVASLVEAFASGYYNALGSNNTLHVRIAIATSNGTTMCGGNQVTFAHGHAWAQMVNTVAAWVISQGYSGQIDIAGGSDMEPGAEVWPANSACNSAGQRVWAPRADTRSWVDGYSSVVPRRYLYDVGDAGGCPQSGTTALARGCNGGYDQEDIWYISWGAPPSEPLPEIYTSSGSMAAQWQQLSLYGYLAHAGNMIMAGALTQSGACQQVGCSALTANSPSQGWQQLYSALNGDQRTKQTLSWSTDIKKLYWFEGKRMNTASVFVKISTLAGTFASLLLAQSATLPPEKQAIEQQYGQERTAGAQNPAPKNPAAPYPIAPEPPFPTGVLDDCGAPFSSAEANIVNCWAGVLNGIKTIVYAGAEGTDQDPQQGLVYLVAAPPYPAPVSGSRVLTPVKGGAVRIVAAQNTILTLVSATGSYVLTFDVNTRTFTSFVVDTTLPRIAGMPGQGCKLWPPNGKLVQVASVTASDDTMVAPGTFKVTGSSNQPILPTDPKTPDIVITATASGGYDVQLRADRLGTVATDRIYTLTATATDIVGNVATVVATCAVPHDQGQ
jgi:hypothetical protein